MQMKKIHPLLLGFLVACPMLLSQESRRVPPGGASGSAAGSAVAEPRRSEAALKIRRGLVVARPDTYDPKTLKLIEDLTRQFAEALNAEAKLAQSGAPAAAVAPIGLQRFAAQVRAINDERRAALNIIRMTPGSAGGDSPRCSAESCGSSICFPHQNICICTLCWPRRGSGAGAPSAAAGPASDGGADLLVVAAPAGAGEMELDSLIWAGLAELRSMPDSQQLVIRTMSLAK